MVVFQRQSGFAQMGVDFFFFSVHPFLFMFYSFSREKTQRKFGERGFGLLVVVGAGDGDDGVDVHFGDEIDLVEILTGFEI